MNREDVVEALIVILKEIQSEVSDEVEEINVSTCPVGGMSHFDSLMGVVVTARCFEKFDIKDDNKTVSLFEEKKSGEPQTIGDVADRIISLKSKE
jgi:hypothetical protein